MACGFVALSETWMDVAVVESGQKKAHTFRGFEEKRRIVEETLVAGASVSSVARSHGINANQVFQWRKLYRDCLLDGSSAGEVRLLPVTVSGGGSCVPSRNRAAASLEAGSPDRCPAGSIELEFDGGRLRVAGAVDGETLRTVLGCLWT